MSLHTKETKSSKGTLSNNLVNNKNKKEKNKKEKEMNEIFESSGTSSLEENWLNDFIVNVKIEQEVPVEQESGNIFDDFDLTESKSSDIPPHVLHQLGKIIKFKTNRKLQGFRPIRCLNDFNEAADILLKEALLHVSEDEWRSYLFNEVEKAKGAFAKEWTSANLSHSDMYRPTVNMDYEAYAKVTF